MNEIIIFLLTKWEKDIIDSQNNAEDTYFHFDP